MITPDDLAQRFPAPATTDELRAQQGVFKEGALQLAERAVDLLHQLRGDHHLDQVILALESADHWVSAGLAALQDQLAAAAVDADDAPVPYVLGGSEPRPPAMPPVPDTIEGLDSLGDLDLNVDLWRTGLRGASTLHALARLVAHVLADHAGATGFIADADQPSINALALATGLEAGTVLQALEDLAIHGWVARYNDGRNPTRYQLRLPAAAPRQES